MKRVVIILLLLLVAITGVVVANLNAGAISFNYYFSSITLPLAVLLFLVLSIGALLGVLLSLGMVFKARREQARISKRLKMCEQEIKNLREIPIKGSF
jgi:putative membrane protein